MRPYRMFGNNILKGHKPYHFNLFFMFTGLNRLNSIITYKWKMSGKGKKKVASQPNPKKPRYSQEDLNQALKDIKT